MSSNYSACLSILESYKANYLLNIHLQRHIPEPRFQIRGKAIQQYFIPISCVTLSALVPLPRRSIVYIRPRKCLTKFQQWPEIILPCRLKQAWKQRSKFEQALGAKRRKRQKYNIKAKFRNKQKTFKPSLHGDQKPCCRRWAAWRQRGFPWRRLEQNEA